MNYLLQPIIQIEDSNGKPLVGGKVYVYDKDTEDLATIYSDFEGHYATNPVILDSLGHAKILADADKVYTVIVKDANDELLFSIPNATIISGSGDITIVGKEVTVASGKYIEVDRSELLDGTIRYTVSTNAELDTRFDNIENDIESFTESFREELTELSEETSNLQQNVNNLSNTVTTLGAEVDSHSQSISVIDTNITSINNKIPVEASSTNKLADKKYVDDMVSQIGGRYITNAEGEAFETHSELIVGPWYTEGEMAVLIKNDYAIVNGDETHGGTVTRYMYDGTAWTYQYTINTTVFTQEQLNAINSGITLAKVNKLDGIADGAEVNVQSDWNVSDTNSKAYIVNKPTSLPASDVSQWAKATTKPSYTASEVGTYSSSEIDTLLSTKAADSSVVHKTGNETIAGEKTFTSSPIFKASFGNTDIQAYKPGTTTQERCSLTYTFDGKRGVCDSKISDFALLIDSNNQVTLNGKASSVSLGVSSYGRKSYLVATPSDTSTSTSGSTCSSPALYHYHDDSNGHFVGVGVMNGTEGQKDAGSIRLADGKGGYSTITHNSFPGNSSTASKVTINSGTGKLVTKDSAGNAFSSDEFGTSTNSTENVLYVSADSTKQAKIMLGSKNTNYNAFIQPANGFSSNHYYTLPDKTGTIALTSNIPSGIALLSSNNTFTGTNTFEGTLNGNLNGTATNALNTESRVLLIKVTHRVKTGDTHVWDGTINSSKGDVFEVVRYNDTPVTAVLQNNKITISGTAGQYYVFQATARVSQMTDLSKPVSWGYDGFYQTLGGASRSFIVGHQGILDNHGLDFAGATTQAGGEYDLEIEFVCRC